MVKINKKRIDFVCDVEKIREGFEIFVFNEIKSLYCLDQTFIIKISEFAKTVQEKAEWAASEKSWCWRLQSEYYRKNVIKLGLRDAFKKLTYGGF